MGEEKAATEEIKNNEPEYQFLGIEPVEKSHNIRIGGKSLKYTSRAGVLPLKDEKGEIEAEIFFTAYQLLPSTESSSRPLTFVFNGGPGSSSIWLHMGALGPKRVVMEPMGWMPSPPYRLEDNQNSWLDRTDLVFVDPVETGFSRAATEKVRDKFWGYSGDIESVGAFIKLYLTRYQRWTSPLFLAGESYGTTRAAALAGDLIDKGIAFNGIVLISTALNLRPIFFAQGDDLPFHLFVPTYAAAAWYHKKLSEKYLKMNLPVFLKEVEHWAETKLALALLKGDRLSDKEIELIAAKLEAYTGLSSEYVRGTNLRINIHRFCKELLRDEKRSVGRLDSRFKGIEADAANDMPEFDPSMTAIKPCYTSTFNDYARRELGVETDLPYRTMHQFPDRKWKWENGRLPDTGECLREAMARNPFMKVLVAQGYYDLATPHFATEYMVSHMNMDKEIRKNLTISYYNAGHMFYLDCESLASFRRDIETFLDSALSQNSESATGSAKGF